MDTVEWPEDELPVSRFYGRQTGYASNEVSTEYDSGRVMSYQRNTRQLRQFSLTYAATKEQAVLFDTWFRETLGGTAGRFTMPSLADDEEDTVTYRFTSTPSYSGQNLTDIEMELEEV